MKKSLFAVVALVLIQLSSAAQPVISKADKTRAAEIVKEMTLEEKCLLVAGQEDGFHTYAIERLGVPSVRMADGPQGVRNDTRSTYYPCGMSLAASWNRDLAKMVGNGIGFDARARGVGIMLCPGVNIYRSALCGRNFEYYGEDPFLASEIAVGYISGIQEKGVMSTIKHFALNNQEYHRYEVSSDADECTINEIYFPTFRKAVEKAHVAAVMTSYNPVNHVHAAENPWLIKDNLRAWGHEGIVMSDWSSTYTTLGCIQGGLDLEMPEGCVLNYGYIKPLIDNGVISEKALDEKCIHILSSFSAYGFLDAPVKDPAVPEDYEVSRDYAYRAALEGPVLLQNDGILPLKPSRGSIVIVLGPNADIVPFGGGSGEMHPFDGRSYSLYRGLDGMKKNFKIQLMDWKNPDSGQLKKAAAVIFAAGFGDRTEREGSDRTYSLPDGQSEAIASIAAVNPNVIVVANSGGEFDILPWKDKVRAIVLAWYGGQEGGKALAAILTGKANPSGKLPFTWWGSNEKNPSTPWYNPCQPYESPKRWRDFRYTFYGEGMFVGYRGVEKYGVTPLYPFGYGLSYTDFAYSDPAVVPSGDGFDVTFRVRNVGKSAGAEVAQVYVMPLDPKLPRPRKELKGFAKVLLEASESTVVSIHLDGSSFKHYDSAIHDWKLDDRTFNILVGPSSAEVRLTKTIVL